MPSEAITPPTEIDLNFIQITAYVSRTGNLYLSLIIALCVVFMVSTNYGQVSGQTSKSYDNPLLGFKFQYNPVLGEPSQGNSDISFIFDKPDDGNFAFDKLSNS